MWKTLIGRCIYKSDSNIKIHQNIFYRWLTINSDDYQTVLNRKNPETPALGYLIPLTLPVLIKPDTCCLLGLGGGAIPHLLSGFLGKIPLVAVESNSEIITLSKQYFGVDKIKNLIVIHNDAKNFVIDHQNQYQYILVDLFTESSFPDECNNYEFFQNCKKLLNTNGVLGVNVATSHENWEIFKHIRTVFHLNTIVFPIKNSINTVILACNADSVLPLLDLIKNNWRIKKISWDDKWGLVAEM